MTAEPAEATAAPVLPVREVRPYRARLLTLAFAVLYSCGALQFVRFYVVSTTFYLNLPAYLAGHERLPFQYRVLPALLIRGMYAVHLLSASAAHQKGAFTPERAPLFLLSLLGVIAVALCTQAIYNSVSSARRLQYVVFPVLLYTLIWTYAIHVEANFSYPYDLLAVAFFAAGLLCIVRRRYPLLLAVMAVGTLNRETTLFLVVLYLLDSAIPPGKADLMGQTVSPFAFRQAAWLRTALLFSVWLVVKLLLAHHYKSNDRSEDYVRLGENMGRLTPRLWPALLNICGYMMPVVLLLRGSIYPLRLRLYLWIFPIWFAVMFYSGVIVETRIYGELCPLVAVSLVALMERSVELSRDDLPILP